MNQQNRNRSIETQNSDTDTPKLFWALLLGLVFVFTSAGIVRQLFGI